MVRENRVKVYYTGSLTTGSPAQNNVVVSDTPINGKIQKVVMNPGLWANNGSLIVRISGGYHINNQELILSVLQVSGASPLTYYPRVVPVIPTAAGDIGYSGAVTELVVNGHIQVTVSGAGYFKSGAVEVHYI